MIADDVLAVLELPEYKMDERGMVACPMPECEDGKVEYEDHPSRSREEPTFTRGDCDLCEGFGRVSLEIALAAEIVALKENA